MYVLKFVFIYIYIYIHTRILTFYRTFLLEYTLTFFWKSISHVFRLSDSLSGILIRSDKNAIWHSLIPIWNIFWHNLSDDIFVWHSIYIEMIFDTNSDLKSDIHCGRLSDICSGLTWYFICHVIYIYIFIYINKNNSRNTDNKDNDNSNNDSFRSLSLYIYVYIYM